MSRNGKRDSYELDTSSLPALPKGWCWTTLGQLRSESLNGYGKRKGEDGKPIIVLRLADIQDGRISLESPRRINSTTEDIRRYCLKSDDLLIIRVNGSPDLVGRFVRVDGNPEATLFCDHFIRIRLFEPRTSSYVRLFADTGSARKYIDSHKVCSAGQNTISQSSLDGMPVPLPPFNEQCRIKAKIEELFSDLDAGVAALERVKANLKRYRASVLKAAVEGRLTEEWRKKNRPKETGQQLLDRILKERRRKWEEEQLAAYAKAGKTPPAKWKDKYKEPAGVEGTNLPALPEGWCWATVEQLCEVGTGTTPSRANREFYDGGSIPWVMSTAVNSPFVDQGTEHVTQAAVDATTLQLYPAGTLLIALYGEGKTRGMVSELRIAATINQALGALVFQGAAEHVRPFVKVFLASHYVELRRQAAGGMQPNLNLGLVKRIQVPVPSLDEQHQIVCGVSERFSQMELPEGLLETNLKRSTRLRQAILKQAFEGKLVHQDPTDEPASVLLERLKAANGNGAPRKATKIARNSK